VLSCDPAQAMRIKQMAVEYGLSADTLGETVAEQLEISLDGSGLVAASVSSLRESYEGALEQALRADVEVVAV